MRLTQRKIHGETSFEPLTANGAVKNCAALIACTVAGTLTIGARLRLNQINSYAAPNSETARYASAVWDA